MKIWVYGVENVLMFPEYFFHKTAMFFAPRVRLGLQDFSNMVVRVPSFPMESRMTKPGLTLLMVTSESNRFMVRGGHIDPPAKSLIFIAKEHC